MIEAEQGVIGSVLIDNKILSTLIETGLVPEMFESDMCGEAYRKMLAMYDSSQMITAASLSAEMEDQKFDKEAWMYTLQNCLNQVATSIEGKVFAKIVITEWRCRTTRMLFQRADLRPSAIDNTIGNVITALEEIAQNVESPVKSMKKVVEDNKANYFTDTREQGVNLGFQRVDETLGGMEKGNVTVIAARPKVGKSAFATQIISELAKKCKVGYFNLEMGEPEVYERVIARYSGIELRRIRRALNFTNDEKERFDRANEEVSALNIDIISGAQTVSRLKALCKHQNYDVVVIDYMQLLQTERNYGNRAAEVGQISADIKRMAMELKTHIIALSQLNRTHNETAEPRLEDLRESGAIEQDASNVIFLWNISKKDKSQKGLKIAKNRQGEEAKYRYEFDGKHMTFREIGELADEDEDDFTMADENPFA